MDTLRDDPNAFCSDVDNMSPLPAGKRLQKQPPKNNKKYVCTCYAQEFFPITSSFRYNRQKGTYAQ